MDEVFHMLRHAERKCAFVVLYFQVLQTTVASCAATIPWLPFSLFWGLLTQNQIVTDLFVMSQ